MKKSDLKIKTDSGNDMKNVTLDYFFSFLRNFGVSQAIWVLFMVYRGQNLMEVGIAEGVFHVTSLLCEVPSGAAADLLGRKRVMILGRILSVLSSVCMLYAHSLPAFCGAFILSALSYNLLSGTEDSLVYDSMKASGAESGYISVSSRLNIIIEIAQGAGTFLGGVLSDRSFVLCYLVDILVVCLSLLPLLMMNEPLVHTEPSVQTEPSIHTEPSVQTEPEEAAPAGSTGTLKSHFRTVWQILKENPAVVRILLYYPAVTSFDAVLFFYGQQYFADFGLTRMQISILMVISSAFSCLAALFCTRILNHFGEKTKYIISVIMGLSILACAYPDLRSAAFFFILANAVNSLIYPIESSSLNALIPSAQRATIISVDSMCYSVSMILFFPLCGVVATYANLHVTFAALGILQLCLMGLLLHRFISA